LKIHIVQKGDTLWEIAKMYDVDFEELEQSNSQISSPDMIMPGMKIKIPSTSKSVKKEAPMKEKTVKEKETKEQPTKKPAPVVKGDEKEKKKEVKPEIPLPQMPQTPQIPEYPIMHMPTYEQEMKNYTMINMPQVEEVKKEKSEETTSKKEKKESKKVEQKTSPKKSEEHMPLPQTTPPQMTIQMDGYEHMSHMCPVCCNHFMHALPMPHMMGGHYCCQHEKGPHCGHYHIDDVGGGHYPHPDFHPIQGIMPSSQIMQGNHEWPVAAPIPPMNFKDDGECGCEKFNSYYSLSPKPTIELADNQRSMGHYQSQTYSHSENHFPVSSQFGNDEDE